MSFDERPFSFDSDGLRIEAALHEGGDALAAAVLHPHPQYGGDMDNHVVMALCRVLADAGATMLRFNFRGAGRSQGSFDGGRGEAGDARAAVDALRELRPGASLVLAGYSFGALVAASIARETAPRALVLVSPPVAFAPFPDLPEDAETLLVTGEWDDIAPPDRLRALAGPGWTVAVVPEAGHAWWPGVDLLTGEVSAFVQRLTHSPL